MSLTPRDSAEGSRYACSRPVQGVCNQHIVLANRFYVLALSVQLERMIDLFAVVTGMSENETSRCHGNLFACSGFFRFKKIMPLQSLTRPGDGDLSDVASFYRRLFYFSTSYRFRVTLEMCRRQVGGAAESPAPQHWSINGCSHPFPPNDGCSFGRGIAWPFGIKGLTVALAA